MGMNKRYLEECYLQQDQQYLYTATANMAQHIIYNDIHMQIAINVSAFIAYDLEGANSIPPDSFDRVYWISQT